MSRVFQDSPRVQPVVAARGPRGMPAAAAPATACRRCGWFKHNPRTVSSQFRQQ